MPREDEEIQSAFAEQAGSADGSRELCDLFGLDAGGTSAARRVRILSLVDGPPSRRRWGWLDGRKLTCVGTGPRPHRVSRQWGFRAQALGFL